MLTNTDCTLYHFNRTIINKNNPEINIFCKISCSILVHPIEE